MQTEPCGKEEVKMKKNVVKRTKASVKRSRKVHPKKEGMLVSVAESIGSTLGAIAAKTNAAQKALGGSRVSRKRPSSKT
jgi:hypothetical protein